MQRKQNHPYPYYTTTLQNKAAPPANFKVKSNSSKLAPNSIQPKTNVPVPQSLQAHPGFLSQKKVQNSAMQGSGVIKEQRGLQVQRGNLNQVRACAEKPSIFKMRSDEPQSNTMGPRMNLEDQQCDYDVSRFTKMEPESGISRESKYLNFHHQIHSSNDKGFESQLLGLQQQASGFSVPSSSGLPKNQSLNTSPFEPSKQINCSIFKQGSVLNQKRENMYNIFTENAAQSDKMNIRKEHMIIVNADGIPGSDLKGRESENVVGCGLNEYSDSAKVRIFSPTADADSIPTKSSSHCNGTDSFDGFSRQFSGVESKGTHTFSNALERFSNNIPSQGRDFYSSGNSQLPFILCKQDEEYEENVIEAPRILSNGPVINQQRGKSVDKVYDSQLYGYAGIPKSRSSVTSITKTKNRRSGQKEPQKIRKINKVCSQSSVSSGISSNGNPPKMKGNYLHKFNKAPKENGKGSIKNKFLTRKSQPLHVVKNSQKHLEPVVKPNQADDTMEDLENYPNSQQVDNYQEDITSESDMWAPPSNPENIQIFQMPEQDPEPLSASHRVHHHSSLKIPKNDNKFIKNNVDGGRRRKQRGLSRIEMCGLTSEDLDQSCKVLFPDSQSGKSEPMDDVQQLMSPQFPQIQEENLEESPDTNHNQKSTLGEQDMQTPGQEPIRSFQLHQMQEQTLDTDFQNSNEVLEAPIITEDMFAPSDVPTLLETIPDETWNPIDGESLANLIQTQSHPYIIVDARYDYEFNAGHIKGALNISTPQELMQKLFGDQHALKRHMEQKTIIIFHCEFSYKRGPLQWQTLREIDRNANMETRYPKLFYPESYLLKGGFSQFYQRFPDCCEGHYMRQDQADSRINKQRTTEMRNAHREFPREEIVQMLKSRVVSTESQGLIYQPCPGSPIGQQP